MDLPKLKMMMDEIYYLLESYDNGLKRGLNPKRILKRFSLIINAEAERSFRKEFGYWIN